MGEKDIVTSKGIEEESKEMVGAHLTVRGFGSSMFAAAAASPEQNQPNGTE